MTNSAGTVAGRFPIPGKRASSGDVAARAPVAAKHSSNIATNARRVGNMRKGRLAMVIEISLSKVESLERIFFLTPRAVGIVQRRVSRTGLLEEVHSCL